MKTKVKKALIIILCILLIIAILASAFVVYINANLIKDTEIQEFNTNDTSFKVAVISDTQLPPTEEDLKNDDTYLKNFKNALTVIKNNDADMIMFAGDIGDLGTRFAFQTYVDAIDDVFGDDKPIVQTVMGNHDFWNKNAKTAINHIKAFEEIMGQSPWT
ncbi:MAG: metallophosphoesterase family protein, partial [Oscillospiraceae bacterium]|nr:metallophosphoesterase family protein [Oscillospiraceae bacterium]